MINVRRPFSKLRDCFVLGLALAVVSGCNESALRNRVAVVESRLDSVTEKPSQSAPIPLHAAPLRFAVSPLNSQVQAIQTVIQHHALIAPPPFSTRLDKSGKVVLNGVGSFGDKGEKWLATHGFLKHKNTTCERSVTDRDVAALELATINALSVATTELEHITHEISDDAAGHVSFFQDSPSSGTIISTSHVLDFTFADTSGTPELFLDLGGPQISVGPEGISEEKLRNLPHQFARGGRIVVLNGALHVTGNLLHRLVPKSVPANATHLALNSDGIITAYDATGLATELGRIDCVRIKKFKKVDGGYVAGETAPLDEWIQKSGKKPFMPGYVELPNGSALNALANAIQFRNGLQALQSGLVNASAQLNAAAADEDLLPLIIHTPLPKTAEHLKALKIPVEKTNDRTSIGADAEDADVISALVTVLQGLRKRMSLHEENLRNAGKTRDSEGRLNAYRRKTIAIGPQGNVVEGVDKSELPKNYKPGDPDAGPDGFIVLSNVNKTIEKEEFKAAVEEYKLVRTALERLSPKHIFPDPLVVP